MFDSFEVTIMVIGVSISCALNSYNWLFVFFGCCDSVFNTFAVHDSFVVDGFTVIIYCLLNLEAV